MLWTELVEYLRALIFAVAHVCNGSLGLGIFVVSLTLRLALLPLSLRLARRNLARHRKLVAIKPQLDALQQRHRDDPLELLRRSEALKQRHGIKPVDPAALWGSLAPLPVLAGLFSALRQGIGAGVRFVWIRDLSLPSLGLAALVTLATVGGLLLAPSAEQARGVMMAMAVVLGGMTLWFLLSTSAAFGVAAGAGALVQLAQSLILRRGSMGTRPARDSEREA